MDSVLTGQASWLLLLGLVRGWSVNLDTLFYGLPFPQINGSILTANLELGENAKMMALFPYRSPSLKLLVYSFFNSSLLCLSVGICCKISFPLSTGIALASMKYICYLKDK